MAYSENVMGFKVPACCRNCSEFDTGYAYGEGAYPPCCAKGIYLPTKKGTCKRQIALDALKEG